MKYFCSLLLLASTVAFSMESNREGFAPSTRYRFSPVIKHELIENSLEKTLIKALPMQTQDFKVWLEEKVSAVGGRGSAQGDQLIEQLNLLALGIATDGDKNDLANRNYLSSLIDTEVESDLTQIPSVQKKEQPKRPLLTEAYQAITHRRQSVEESQDWGEQSMEGSMFGAMEASNSGNRLARLEQELENNKKALGLPNPQGNRLLELKKENERKAYLLKLQREIEKAKRDEKLKEYQKMPQRQDPPKLDALINRMAQVHLDQSGTGDASLEDSSFGEESLSESQYY